MEPKTDPYAIFYERLGVLRNDFYRIGRFDDANAKLDELCKLFVLRSIDQLFPLSCGRSRLSVEYLSELADRRLGDSNRLASALHVVFDELHANHRQRFAAFGNQPRLGIDPNDDEFAQSLLPVVESLPIAQRADPWSFDLLNEAFGHFVQDSFRHRKEDAQYLTPPEVVAAMVEIGLTDLLADHSHVDYSQFDLRPGRKLLVADPTCGVGSFLAATYCHASQLTLRDRPLSESLAFFGQDKVERMVRMTQVNMQLFSDAHATVRQGNSVTPETLDDVTGQVDLVLTNPPFGASFERDSLRDDICADRFPILTEIQRRQSLPARIDSEFLMFDRCLSLLRGGGRMAIVVPDKVVAASGFADTFRSVAGELGELLAVIDLPAETFAQAGTRTKTSIVYLRKPTRSRADVTTRGVFMATVDDLGFRVTSRAGVSVKNRTGINQLPNVVANYRKLNGAEPSVNGTCNTPSLITPSALLNGHWNASFYRTDRIQSLKLLHGLDKKTYAIRELGELVEIDPDQSKRVDAADGSAIISVLHVRIDGFVDISAVESHSPTSGSVRCRIGDVLISRINPRIVRICVVPEFGRPVACSPEFAVLRCHDGRSPNHEDALYGQFLDPWKLALLLRSQLVQRQVQTLTSGTSSSHNRIKPRELATIQIAVPRIGHAPCDELSRAATEYCDLLKDYYCAARQTTNCFKVVDEFLKRDSAADA